MKRIAQIAFTLLISLLSFQSVFAQDELAISGGNIVSSLVCGNRRVFVWGGNQITGPNAVTGILGTGSPAPYLTTPTEVIFPSGNPSIKQVNSGSGAHFVALDCNTSVWAWGVNDNGQIGIGSNSAGVTTPTKVKAGVVTGTAFDDGAGNLTGVKTVYAGNVNSFAILTDGRLLSWGSNSSASTDASGELGDGTKINRATPVFVMDGSTNLPLTGVTKIFAGDNCAYALVDPVGNGVGTVYSWGAGLNGSLGRAITTGPNPANTATTQSSLAYPVTFKDGSPLNTIVQISAGDVFGMALDQDGTIWAWGNGGWGGCTGTGTFTTTHSDPRRVLAGQAAGTADAINISGTEYLVASFIGAGQGFAMAVTQSGIPMAWGNNGGNPGGVLGNGGAATSYVVPQYIINKATGVSDNNVIYINRGDTWGFYVTADNKYYTWGYNGQGQLGTGSTTTETMAVPISPPSGCAFKDPAPDAKIKPTKLTVCASKFTTQLLTNSFSITNPTIAARYAVKWYKNGTQQGATLNATTGRTFAANSLGLYKVTVDYIGSNGECKPYPQAVDTMSIVGYPKTYTVPALTYCGTTATVNVTSTATTKARYDWFPTVGSTTSLGFSAGSATTSINVSGIVANSAGDKIVYVEETGYASGTVFKKTDACDPFTTMDFLNTGANNPNFQSQFTSYEPLKLTEVKIRLENEIYNVGNSYTGTINFNVYGSKSTGGGPVADQASVLGSFSYTYTRTRAAADPQIATQDVTIPLSITLPPVANGQVFFLSPDPNTLTSVTTGGGALKLGRANCAQTVPKVDDVNGTIVAYTGMSQNFSNNQTGGNIGGGHFFDVKFATAQKFCDRTLVTLKQQCPCKQPTNVTITANQPITAAAGTTPKKVTVCQGTSVNLDGSFVNGVNPLTGTMSYVWYKKGTTPVKADYAATTGTTVGTKTLTGALTDSSVWYLRVEDLGANPISNSCYKEDSILVAVKKLPIAPTFKDTSVCVGSINNKVLANTTASGNTLKWYNAAGTLVITDPNPIDVTAASVQTFQVSQILSAANGSCEGPKAMVKFTVKAKPVKPVITPDKNPICAGKDLVLTATSTTLAATFTWTKPIGSNAAAVLGIMSKTSAAVTEAGWYNVTATDAGCTDSTNIKVIVNAKPIKATIAINPNKTKFCEGEAHTLTASSTASSSFAWTGDGTGTTNPLAGKTTAGTYRYIVTPTLNGCPGDSGSLVITVDPKPFPATVSDIASACVKDPIKTTATPVPVGSPGTGSWKIESSTTTGYGLTGLTDPQTLVTIPTTPANGDKIVATWTVKNGVCKDTSKTMTITFNAVANPTVGLTAGGSVCEGANVTFKANGNNTGTSGFTYTLYNKDKTVARPAQTSTDFVFNNVATDLEYYVSLTSTSTCRAKDTANSSIVKVAVIKNPVAPITGPIPIVSKGSGTYTFNTNPSDGTNTVDLVATTPGAGYKGQWTSDSLGFKTPIDTTNPSTRYIMGGYNTKIIKWTVRDAGRICPSVTSTLTVIRKNFTVADVEPNKTLCELPISSFTLQGNAYTKPDEYVFWGVNGGEGTSITVPNAADSTKSVFTVPTSTTNKTYKFYYSVFNKIAKKATKDSVFVTIQANPTTPEISTNGGADITMCGKDQQLAIDPAKYTVGQVKWTIDKGLTISDPASTKADTLKTILTEGYSATTGTATAVVTVTNGLCPAKSDQIKITRSGELTSPNLVPVTVKSVCIGGSLSFTGNAANVAGNAEYSKWEFKPSTDITVDTSVKNKANITFAKAGSYDLIYTIDNPTCPAKAETLTVTVIEKPLAEILNPITVLSGKTGQYSYGSTSILVTSKTLTTGYTGLWSADSAAALSSPLNTETVTVQTPGYDKPKTIKWTVSDAGKVCKDTSAIIVITRKNFTVADVEPNKNICDSPSSNLNIKALSKPQASVEYVTWSVKKGNSTITNATSDSSEVTFTAGDGPGTYEFYYFITNKTLGKTTKDSITIRVDHITAMPTLTAGFTGTSAALPYKICSTTLNLPGVANPDPAPLGKNWWIPAGTATIPAKDSTSSPLMTVQTGPGSATYYYKNGVCPVKSIDFFFEKVGDVTRAAIAINGGKPAMGKQYVASKDSLEKMVNNTADTLCLGGTYKLTTIGLKVGELGTWSYVAPQGTSVSFASGLNSETMNMTVNAIGETKIKWSIKNSSPALASCPANEVTVSLVVRDVPAFGVIDGYISHCEGSDSSYKVNPLSTSVLPVTYTWDAGANPGAFRTGVQKGESTRYRMYSNTAGSTTQGIISVTPSNACGSGTKLTKTVGIQLAPRALTGPPIGDTIVGPVAFCASSGSAKYILKGHSDVETFSWSWDNTLPIITNNGPTDSAVINQSPHWDPLAKADKVYTLQVDLLNRCSDTAKKNGILPVVLTKSVTVIAPKSVSVDLASDKTNDKFCIPDNTVKFKAAYKSDYPGLKGTYEFFLNGISMQTGLLDEYPVAAGVLKDADVVTVKFSPDAKQCVILGNPVSDPVKMEGFVYPNAKVDTSTKTIICEDAGGVGLIVNKLPKTYLGNDQDNGVITWYKINPLNLADSTKLTGPAYSGFSIPLNRPEESGLYAVKVGRNVVCKDTSRTLIPQKVRIYEKPEALVLANPFPVPYTEGINIYHMPVVVTKPIKDTLTKSEYFPNTWLEKPNNPTTLLLPEKEDKEITYTLTLETGNGVCQTTIQVTVVYFLPIDIPNAFTPNGDGLNDDWVIKGLGKYPGTKVKVYNRWGSSMYIDNDGYKAVWNGTHNGEPLPAGTYYYIVELKGSPDNTDQSKTGALTIIR